MKKKPKISYRDLAKPDTAAPDAGAPDAGAPAKGARGQEPVAAELPGAPDAPKAIDTQTAPVAPRRISSPVEVATTLRLTPPLGLTAVTAVPAAVAAVPGARPPAPGAQPAAEDPAAATTVEDYATSLMRRLAAMAPAEINDADELDAERRPLRERVRDRAGLADLLMFRIGEELFATDLSAVEEAVTLPEIHHLPEMPAAMLGAFNLRGRLTPVYSPSQVIGVPLRGQAQAALLVRSGNRRLGLAVDDVEDVFQVDLANVREAPGTDDADGILLGVAHHGTELVAIVDAEALVAACVTGHAMEITA